MRRGYTGNRNNELSGFGSVSRTRFLLICIASAPTLAACATISVYEPVTAEVSLVEDVSVLRKASEAFCKEMRDKGLAVGEASLNSLADMLRGKDAGDSVYWRRIAADKDPPEAVAARVRSDLAATVKGMEALNGLVPGVLKAGATRGDVSEYERALIHARQTRDSLADALVELNKRGGTELQINAELASLDQLLGRSRLMADDLAAARAADDTAAS